MKEIRCSHLDLKKIHESGQVLMGWNVTEPGKYRIVSGKHMLNATQTDYGALFECPAEDEVYWEHYFDLETDYGQIEKAFPADPYLNEALDYGRGIRILNQDLWETVISFIVSQNNNIPRITKSLNAIRNGRESFPDADELYEERARLSECGLGYRDRYLVTLLEELHDGNRKLDFDSDMKKAYGQLTDICGIGAKVANCILLFGMHHMDCCPVDTWMKKVFENHYDGQPPLWVNDPNAGYYQQVTFFYERSGAGSEKQS
ncbi:MAG: DNA-3-methyladenine glycosylase family protein [Lachnospiraceae bacterium]